MATTILPFVIRPRTRSVSRAPGGDATIIIFPGVRYEASPVSEDVEKQKQRDGRSRRRKTKAH